jgi:hypothetical protein
VASQYDDGRSVIFGLSRVKQQLNIPRILWRMTFAHPETDIVASHALAWAPLTFSTSVSNFAFRLRRPGVESNAIAATPHERFGERPSAFVIAVA